MSRVTIRPATSEDAASLAATYRSAYAQNRALGFPAKAASATAEQVGEWIANDWVFVACAPAETGNTNRGPSATAAEHVVGGVRLQPTDENRVKLSRLAVHEEWKGRGVGGELLDHAERTIRERGYGVVWLTTPARHPFLPDWYVRCGYEATGPYPLAYREYDEVVFERRVE